MTDNEIIKVLAEHIAFSIRCGSVYSTVNITLLKEVLDLINRQKAEEETMQSYIDCLKAEIEDMNNLVVYNAACATKLQLKLVEAKAEAVKEFAERLKKCSQWLPLVAMPDPFVIVSDIDNLVKEMAGADGD